MKMILSLFQTEKSVSRKYNQEKRECKMYNTKIEWCDSTWNPVTGCLNGCKYCYARTIANRFKGCDVPSTYGVHCKATWTRVNPESSLDKAMFEVDSKCPPVNVRFDPKTQERVITKAPYPWGFQPTLRRDKLSKPSEMKKPRTIFVCSMADLFGEWIPDKWIDEVFNACSPRHRYLFLTKNPKRYVQYGVPIESNMWYGTSITKAADFCQIYKLPAFCHTFVSVEPLLEDLEIDIHGFLLSQVDWIIIGAETGHRSDKVVPKKQWVMDIVRLCRERKKPVFMKDSLLSVVGEENLIREFPW